MNTADRDEVMRMTAAHIRRVGELMVEMGAELMRRAVNHDASKWSAEEWESFARETPTLKGLTYGSPEYKAALERLGPALQAHYKANRHHPEFHGEAGVDGMNILDLMEMICDWKAATERHADGNIESSITKNTDRFKLSPQTAALRRNTVRDLGWGTPFKSPVSGSSC